MIIMNKVKTSRVYRELVDMIEVMIIGVIAIIGLIIIFTSSDKESKDNTK